jgi:NitT/TauT family transport system ATP-binding protein/sulfonate transport system ATP-binding protein
MQMGQERIDTPVIDCKNIRKTFASGNKTIKVIDNISFGAYENEFLVVFGPGQCGKTTLLTIIAGLEAPDEGQVLINGKKVAGPNPACGLVYQTIALFPWLTTMGNVEFGPRVRKENKKERRARAQKYIELVGLKGFEKSYPIQLSGGMRQRVGIARVYCNEPEVMLMDEPFGHLDAQTRYLMQEEVERIWKQERRTVVFVTNNIEEAVYLADRIIVLTKCPSVVKTEFKIDLSRPRDYTDTEFLKLRKEISNYIDSPE